MSKAIAGISFGFLVVLIVAVPVFAHHRAAVLGVSTSSSDLLFPPVTSGPGLILPDSPWYFLDHLKQNIRLFFASSPVAKAKVHDSILGERMAELRIMFARDNKVAISQTLLEVEKEVSATSNALTDASAGGASVSKLAVDIDNDIKEKNNIIRSLIQQSNGVFKSRLETTRDAIKEARVTIEDQLPGDQLKKEIEEGIEDEMADKVTETRDAVAELENSLQELNREASDAAKNALSHREEALKEAIAQRNEKLKEEKMRALELERQKQHEILVSQTQAVEQARKAITSSHQAAKEFETLRQKTDQLRNFSVDENQSSAKSSGSGSHSTSGKSDSGGKYHD